MTPYELSFLLHIHTSPAPFPLAGTELYGLVTDNFCQEGIIEKNNDVESGWSLTPLGEAFIQVILHVPKPKPCFVDYAGKLVIV